MTTIERNLSQIDGANVPAPTQNGFSASNLSTYPNDAAYETQYGVGQEGDLYFNTTIQSVRYYKNGEWQDALADEIEYDNGASGLTATEVQAAIDEIVPILTGKQEDVITTRGDVVIGGVAGDAERLAVGASDQVLSTDGTDVFWAAGGGGGAAVGGKNYILNPDAESNTNNVANTATGLGSWSVARTLVASELPEETKGTAFKISGSGLTVGDTVEWAIESTGIDDADGGVFGRAKVSVKDISGSINGEYSIQVYDVDNSVYVGDEETITGTGTYYLDVPFVAANDYEFHLKAETTNPTAIGISGVTIEPVSQTVAGVIGKVTSYSPTITGNGSGLTSYTLDYARYAIVGNSLMITGKVSSIVVPDASITQIYFPLPSGYTFNSNTKTGAALYANDSSVYDVGRATTDSTNSTTALTLLPSTGNWSNPSELEFQIIAEVVELANAHTPTASDVQYENARARVYGDGATLNSTPTIITFDNADFNTGGFTYSSGQFTCLFDGYVDVKASLEASSGSGGVLMVAQIYKNTTSIAQGQIKDSSFVQVSDTVPVSVGDTLEIRGSAPSGSPILSSNQDGTYFTVARVPDYSARKASLPFNVSETKVLASNITNPSASTTFLTFTGLEVGARYSLSGQLYQAGITTGNNSRIELTQNLDSGNPPLFDVYPITGMEIQTPVNIEFTATSSTVGFNVYSSYVGIIAGFSGGRERSWVTLTKLPTTIIQ